MCTYRDVRSKLDGNHRLLLFLRHVADIRKTYLRVKQILITHLICQRMYDRNLRVYKSI